MIHTNCSQSRVHTHNHTLHLISNEQRTVWKLLHWCAPSCAWFFDEHLKLHYLQMCSMPALTPIAFPFLHFCSFYKCIIRTLSLFLPYPFLLLQLLFSPFLCNNTLRAHLQMQALAFPHLPTPAYLYLHVHCRAASPLADIKLTSVPFYGFIFNTWLEALHINSISKYGEEENKKGKRIANNKNRNQHFSGQFRFVCV